VPRVGFLRDLDDGHQLCPDHREGTVTWAEWLSQRVTAGELPRPRGAG
jgi:hypothetical protein